MMPARELGEKHAQQLVDGEIIQNMMSGLTRRLAHLVQKKPTTEGESHEHDDHEHGIITMAGSNEGATMIGEMMSSRDLRQQSTGNYSNKFKSGMNSKDDPSSFTSSDYLNSNFQGVNNSIMLGGTYSANDPGIHLEIDHHDKQLQPPSSTRHPRKDKKINTYSSSSSSSSKSDH